MVCRQPISTRTDALFPYTTRVRSREYQCGEGREQRGRPDGVVVDGAGMIGTRQMERVLSEAERAGAKVVLVGDPEQLQAIEVGAAFRSLAERHGAAEISEVRRQHEDWQKDATRALATGRTGEAIHAYAEHGMVHAAETREAARAELIDTWDAQRLADPEKTRIILTHTNAEVRDLNQAARDRLREAGELGQDVRISAERGAREFATGDRIMFLKNERGLGVKNGTLGKVERVSPDSMAVRLDDGRQVAFDLKDYAHVDHRSEEHTSELQSLMRNSYDVFCLRNNKQDPTCTPHHTEQSLV